MRHNFGYNISIEFKNNREENNPNTAPLAKFVRR